MNIRQLSVGALIISFVFLISACSKKELPKCTDEIAQNELRSTVLPMMAKTYPQFNSLTSIEINKVSIKNDNQDQKECTAEIAMFVQNKKVAVSPISYKIVHSDDKNGFKIDIPYL